MTDFPPASQSSKTRFIVFGSVLVAAALIATSVVYSLLNGQEQQESQLGAYAFAIIVCWLSATIALVITAVTADGPNAVSGLFLAIGARTGIPLALGFVASNVGPFSGTDVFGLVLVHYLVGLFVETFVSVKMISQNSMKATVS